MNLSITLPSKANHLEKYKDLSKFLFHLHSLPVRDIIFFDESILGFIILKTPPNTQSYKPSKVFVDISILLADILESKADIENDKFNSSIINTTLGSDDIIFQGENNDEHYIIWKFEVPVTYPKKKVNNPNVLFSCFISDKETKDSPINDSGPIAEKKLADYQPSYSRNLLSELNNQAKSAESKYLLTIEPDVQETQPSIIIDEKLASILKASITIPVSVSLVIKLKSTKPAGRNNILLSSLNIELSEELIKLLSELKEHYYFNILNLSLDFKNGTIDDLNSFKDKFPINFKLIDSVSLSYRLVNNEFLEKDLKQFDNTSNMNQFSKSISIRLTLQVQKFIPDLNTFEDISNVITTSWSPFLDFSIIAPPINNSLKTTTNYSQFQSLPNSQPFKYNNVKKNNLLKPKVLSSQASITSGNQINTGFSNFNINSTKRLSKALISSSSSSVTVNLTTSNNSTLSGLKLTFQGKLNLKLGEIVNWNLQAINNSPNKLNLSLVVQNPINLNYGQKNANTSNNTSSSNLLNSTSDNKEILVYNKVQLFSLYHSLKLNTSGIIILNNDIRIGPLEPNSVFETSLNLIGISQGIFNLDGIKLFDTSSGDGLDFGKLVEVFVV